MTTLPDRTKLNNNRNDLTSTLWLVLLWASAIHAIAPPPSIRFENPFAHADATSHQMGGVNSIVQDNFGFIWMGAENGLGRYDGNNLKLYQSSPDSPRSLPASYIWQLALDLDAVLWVATEGGLGRYDVETDDFTQFTSIGGTPFTVEALSSLAVGADNTLYVGAR